MAIPLGQIRPTLYLLIGACTLLSTAMPASAGVATPSHAGDKSPGDGRIDIKVCTPGNEICVLVGGGGGKIDVCVASNGGPLVGVSTDDGVLIYHPGPNGGHHTGISSNC